MAQIFMVCGTTTVTSTDATAAATTGGPFTLPPWAPDIAWATTTLSDDWPVWTQTTAPVGGTTKSRPWLPRGIASYTSRTFGLIPAAAADEGNRTARIMLTYRAVGELVRT